MTVSIELAEKTWKTGFAPHLPTDGIRALLAACVADDAKLIQGATTCPPPLMCVQDWPCEAGCATSFVWMNTADVPPDTEFPAGSQHGTEAHKVGTIEEHFALTCFKADQTLGEPAGCRWFLNWYDETPRPEALAALKRWCTDILYERGEFPEGGDEPEPEPDDAPPEDGAFAHTATTDLF